MTGELKQEFNDPDKVEKQFLKTCRKLTEAEVNGAMFHKMMKSGVATNDVRNFTNKQSKMKRTNQKFDSGLSKHAMKLKFNDACASANRLRQEKKRLKDMLVNKFKYSKSRCRGVVKSATAKIRNHRYNRKLKATKKV